MDFRFSQQEERLREEVRQFCQKEPPESFPCEIEDEGYGFGGWSRAFTRRLGEKGWLAIAWPKEYGGLGGSIMERFVAAEELAFHRAPQYGHLFGDAVAAGILAHGTEEQKRDFLPKMARAEILWSTGLSEPGAGSDLLNTATRAVKDGDDYIINGQKIWPTGAHLAEWCLILARTDPEAPKSRGLSTFLVDVRGPGVTVNPIIDMSGSESFCEIFLEDVRVPKSCLLGEENRGLPLVFACLEGDRFWGRCLRHAGSKKDLEELVEYVNQARYDGRSLKENQVLRDTLAEIAVELEVCRMINYKAAWLLNKGDSISWQSSVVKTFADELGQRIANVGLQILGQQVQLREDSKWASLRKRFTFLYNFNRGLSLAGGTSEIQRTTIAGRGLGLPRG
ncbi:MAG: acyl-CoA dehydrogenase family protein [Dehalococcoidia bacterium]|nr:acyl-CoA dehydrogenase family protein [Dehalococcoidia bacterium]